jgi:hypothetical protein
MGRGALFSGEQDVRRSTERSDAMTDYSTRDTSVSGWAISGVTFAATIMVLVGIFEAIAGLAAIFDDDFYVVTQNYAFDLDVTAYGWLHLIVGVLVAWAGFSLFSRKPWAGVVAIVLAVVSAVTNFFFIPYYPFWSILMIALAVWVIWAVTRPDALRS